MTTDHGRRVRFSRFELDLETCELHSGGRRVELAPQPSKVLAILVSQAGSLVERAMLRREIWGDSWREWETGLHQAIRRIRVVLGDSARTPSFIETVPRRGYRFIGEVEASPGRTPRPSSAPPRAARRALSQAAALPVLLLLLLAVAPGVPSREVTQAAVGGAEDPPNPEAVRLEREGRYLLSTGKVTLALAKLRRAAALAPDWAVPWSTIAEAELVRPDRDSPSSVPPDGLGRVEAARRALESALVRDPHDGRSWLLLARLRLWEEWDWSGARQALRRALRARPDDPDVWQLIAALETASGRMDEALDAARRAMRLDPVSTALRADLGWTLYYAGRPEDALDECRRTLELEPRNASALQCAVQALLVLGRSAEAASAVVRGMGGRSGPAATESPDVLAAFWQAQIDAAENPETCGSAAASAIPRIASGDTSGALDSLLAGSEEARGWEVPFSTVDPLFAALRGDARFRKVERALGLPDPSAMTGAGLSP